MISARHAALAAHLELRNLAPEDPDTESLIIQSSVHLSRARRAHQPAYDGDELQVAYAALERLRKKGADRALIDRRTAELRAETDAVRRLRFPQSPWRPAHSTAAAPGA
ncbi:MAG: hypothetical protein KDA33_02655 [Phycisphaerales bacterium]|nr:hypothetical protein [Phycisphaerales bacterium]